MKQVSYFVLMMSLLVGIGGINESISLGTSGYHLLQLRASNPPLQQSNQQQAKRVQAHRPNRPLEKATPTRFLYLVGTASAIYSGLCCIWWIAANVDDMRGPLVTLFLIVAMAAFVLGLHLAGEFIKRDLRPSPPIQKISAVDVMAVRLHAAFGKDPA